MLAITHIGRPRVALLASTVLALAMIFPVAGTASAASGSCPAGYMGWPTCELVLDSPRYVTADEEFTVTIVVTTDGAEIADGDVCASSAIVNLRVLALGNHLVANWSMTATNGVATFSHVTVPYVWGGVNPSVHSYSLQAWSGSNPPPSGAQGCDAYVYSGDSAQVTALPAGQPWYDCPAGEICTVTASGTGSAATIFADTTVGSFSAHWDTYTPGGSDTLSQSFYGGCSAEPIDTQGVLDWYHSGPPVLKTIVFSLDRGLVTGGIGHIEVCWGQPIPFITSDGTWAEVPQVDGWYWGVLPPCSGNSTGPCVLFKKSGRYNVAYIGVLAPVYDPKGAPVFS
jgi:hypothetical protein